MTVTEKQNMVDVSGSGHVVHPAENGGPLPSAAEQDEDSVEFRVMRAYARRRQPQDLRPVAQGNAEGRAPVALPSAEPVVEAETKKGRRRSIKKRLRKIFSCVGGGGEADKTPGVVKGGQSGGFRTLGETAPEEEEEEEEAVDELATTLIKLADVSFHPPTLETDSEEDDMERLAGLLLRTCGDELQETHDCNQLFKDLLGSYSLFDKLMSAIFRKMGLAASDPAHEGPKDPKTKIAFTCEVATKLSAADTHPMSRVLGFGARYLKENCSVEESLTAAEETDSEVE